MSQTKMVLCLEHKTTKGWEVIADGDLADYDNQVSAVGRWAELIKEGVPTRLTARFGSAEESKFKRGHRYKLTILPAGARTKTTTFFANYLGESSYPGRHLFDGRPDVGTQEINHSSVKAFEDLGVARW